MGKKKKITIISIIVVLIGCLAFFGIYNNRVKKAKTQEILNSIYGKLEVKDYYGALDVFYSNTFLENKYNDLKVSIQNDLYESVKLDLDNKLTNRDFIGAKNLVEGCKGYLLDVNLQELYNLYEKASYKDTVNKTASMLYSLNLSKELIVALADIVEHNWDKQDKLVGVDNQIKVLTNNKEYAYTIFKSIISLDVGTNNIYSESTIQDVSEETTKDTRVEYATQQTQQTDVTENNTVDASDLSTNTISVLSIEVEELVKVLFNKYDIIYNELFNTTNDRLNYKKDIDDLSLEFDSLLGKILTKNKDLKDTYNNIVNGNLDLYILNVISEEED